uniref:Uncharacterized protein n=1 Tax=Pipistrellus kuhlii TaxID=59472 RepID=A0A7J7XB30_PIPKU|nr:hypothetical protein mPipKuh1_010661 [Pipistrellus kuhlii]
MIVCVYISIYLSIYLYIYLQYEYVHYTYSFFIYIYIYIYIYIVYFICSIVCICFKDVPLCFTLIVHQILQIHIYPRFTNNKLRKVCSYQSPCPFQGVSQPLLKMQSIWEHQALNSVSHLL